MVMALHGAANAANFDDEMWEKYQLGAWLKIDDRKTGAPATRNIWMHSSSDGSQNPQDEKSIYQDTSLEGFAAPGRRALHLTYRDGRAGPCGQQDFVRTQRA